MLHNLLHNKVLHERVILLNVNMQDIPHVDEDRAHFGRAAPRGLLPRHPELRLQG
jgi:KUP system potassium uptake protein